MAQKQKSGIKKRTSKRSSVAKKKNTKKKNTKKKNTKKKNTKKKNTKKKNTKKKNTKKKTRRTKGEVKSKKAEIAEDIARLLAPRVSFEQRASAMGERSFSQENRHVNLFRGSEKQGVGQRTAAAKAESVGARSVYRLYREQLLQLKDVRSVSLGNRFVNGQPTEEIGVRVQVATENARIRIEKSRLFQKIKKQSGSIPLDVVVWDFKTAKELDLADGAGIQSTLAPGFAGSIGTTVCDSITGELGLITCSHVVDASMFTENNGLGTKIPEPASDNKMAEISDMGNVLVGRVPINTHSLVRHPLVDCAWVRSSNPDYVNPNWVVARPVRFVSPSDKDAVVQKTGHKTDKTTGFISSISSTPVELENGEFVDEMFYVTGTSHMHFAMQGDSGALVTLGDNLVGQVRAVAVFGDDSGAVVGSVTLVAQLAYAMLELNLMAPKI